MTTIYTFANLADQDQGAGTDLRPFGQFYAPTSVATQCYNALFGKGHYDGPDKNLEVNLEMQDNDNTTLVRDSSGNGRNGYFKDQTGTLGGEYSFGTTSDLSYEDGPKGYLPRSLHIPARSNQYDPGEIAFGVSSSTKIDWADIPESQGMTIVGWGHMNGSRSSYQFFRRLANGNPLAGSVYSTGIGVGPNHDPYAQASLFTGAVNAGSYLTYRTYSPPSLYHDPNTWFHHAFTIKDSNRTIFVDGEEVATTTSGYSMSYASDAGLYIGSKGRIAGAALFSRELSTDEISEAYSGPEPYAQVMPTISGTPVVGSFITINAGTWNSQSNGAIRYTYKMYSYSDTAGSDERLEKEITTFLTSQKILLRGSSRLAGRYLRFTISAENDGGTDPLEVYETSYTAAVTSGSEPAYVSYNALFGYGKHTHDPQMSAWCVFDSNPEDDQFKKIGAWNIANNKLTASALVEDGPTSYLSQSYEFPNTSLPITAVADVSPVSESHTTGGWIKQNSYGTAGIGGIFYLTSGGGQDVGIFNGFSNLRYRTNTFADLYFNWVNEIGYGNWGHVVGRAETTQAPMFTYGVEGEMFLNGESIAYDNTRDGGGWASPRSGGIGNYLDGNLADFWYIRRKLSDLEISETYTGPEPVNVVPASISGDFRVGYTLSISAGVWDSQNNGTMTKTYQWYRADDINGTNLTAIVGETSSTYTLTINDYKKYLTVKERSSNDGGYDELEDTFAIYTPQIALRGGMLMLKAG